MCGIAGIVGLRNQGRLGQIDQSVRAMANVLSHRGPDGKGFWSATIRNAYVALGHTRLAIIDLSEAGCQPMLSSGGRYVLAYNGELYNYRELRSQLQAKGYSFVSQSDTEVVLHALVAWGTEALAKFNGMWTIAFLDTERGSLLLSRDRFGVKPLYIYHDATRLYFASEIKALCSGTGLKFPVNTAVAGRFLKQSLLDAQNETFFGGITKLPAGHWTEVSLTPDREIQITQPTPFWTLPQEASDLANEDELAEQIRTLFLDAVSIRLRSDVPVGILLSGGIDSSSIVAAVHALRPDNVPHIVSATSDDPRYDEKPYIDRIAEFFGLKVYEVKLRSDPKEAFSLLERAIWFNDEPVGGFSAVAHYMLMERAKELGVTVLLSGQGGDEILCGYRKYQAFYLQSLARERRYLELIHSLLTMVRPPSGFLSDFKLSDAKRYLPAALKSAEVNILGPVFRDETWMMQIGLGDDGIVGRQKQDLYSYSVPVLTHYEDRMSMASSREIRLPFLDYRLVSLLLPLQAEWKLRDGWTKWIFRRAMQPILPREIAWRRDKKPFPTPIGEWLRTEWRQKVKDLFETDDLLIAKWGLVDKNQLRKLYHAYCRNSKFLGFRDVFNPLALEIWAREYGDYLSGPDGSSSKVVDWTKQNDRVLNRSSAS